MTFANPAALWFLTLAVPVLVLHVLRSRRTEVRVSSTQEWQREDRPVAAARPWQRLRWSLPLVLQLLAVLLLSTALAAPGLDTGRVTAQHLVVMVDTSASMGALDGDPTRLATARREVLEVVDGLGDGARVSVISAGAPATVVAGEVAPSEVRRHLEALEVSEGAFDGEVAASLALSLDRPDRSTAYLLVTDGGLSGTDVSLLPPGTEARMVGRRATNLGVTNVVTTDAGELVHVQATVANAGRDAMTTVVRVDVDGITGASTSVQVPGRGRVEVGLDVPQGDELVVHLDSEDLLPLDDRAHAVGPAARRLHVLRVGGDDPFLDALLSGRDELEVTHVAALGAAEQTVGYDLVILDRVPVPEAPVVPWVAIAPPGGAPGVSVDGTEDRPVPVLVRHDHHLLEGLDLSTLAIAEAQRIDAPAATTLVGAEGTPLLVSGSAGGAPFAYLSFELAESNLGLLPAFPVLGDRLLTGLGGSTAPADRLEVGDPLPLELGVDAVVESPSGTRTEVAAGAVPPELDRTGIWKVHLADGVVRRVVVNPPERETLLEPRDGLAIPGVSGGLDGDGAPVRRSLLPWLLCAALAVLAGEWWATARRRGVARRQWTAARVARGAMCAALVAALVLPTFDRRSSSVAAVFVLDVSDSTAGGREAAQQVIRDALDSMPAGAAAGVVLVGAGAKVDAAVDEALDWAGPRVRVDGSATDLASGVRIAAAVAPADHARRIVLISDGQPTSGDVDAEVTRLRRAGIRLDVVPITTSAGPDVLVRAVDVAARARTTDELAVRVRISATTPQQVTVVLHRDGVEVDRRLVDAPAGESEVTFLQPAGPPGTVRWTATVAGPANGIVENDRGRASTRVEGRPQVLVVEGAPGGSARLVEVLTASGAAVEVRNPEDLPDLAGLGTVDAIVLVDVPASALSGAQVATLVTATRELGTGLVTVGGTASYGPGGYLGSPLEELLPVTSEVDDDQRRSRVAQVFAVDVSGSMGACHCAEDGSAENSRLPGGVKKTDIAREAALFALEEIRPDDELGVLALDSSHRWLVDLGPLGDGSAARKGLAGVRPSPQGFDGSTRLEVSLSASAARLRRSDAGLRHIVLFTDGFEDPDTLERLAEEAAELREVDGITVSVMGTGEGSAVELRAIADAGGGRFYPGRDLQELPSLLLEETRVVARQLIVEGEFLPEVTSSAPVVAGLDSAPPVLGYVATTVRPTATRHLQVGDEGDPLLASWQVGLGRVASWTSDGGGRWATGWTSWEGAPDFWAGLVRSVFPEPAGSLAVRFDGVEATITATFDGPVPDGAEVRALVSTPGGGSERVLLHRVDERTFEGAAVTDVTGTYGVGVTATVSGEVVAAVTGTAEQGYSREYGGEGADVEVLEDWSRTSGGRGSVTAAEVFEPSGLEPGRRSVDLGPWLVGFALLLLPCAVALSRLRFASGPDAVLGRERAGRVGAVADAVTRVRPERRREPRPQDAQPGDASAPAGSDAAGARSPGAPPSPGGGSTLDSLLAAKRRRRD